MSVTRPDQCTETPSPLRDQAIATLAVLEKQGWMQGALGRENGVCLIGAMLATSPDHYWSMGDDAMPELCRALVDLLNLGRRSEFIPLEARLTTWNDMPERTYDEVKAALMAFAT